MNWFLQHLIFILIFLLAIITWTAVFRRKPLSWFAPYMAWFILGLCILDALTRPSLWPLGTAITMALSITGMNILERLRKKEDDRETTRSS